jgi:hypothetical protein
MSVATLSRAPAATPRAGATLRAAAGLWWFAALLGQWAFFYYIALFYGPSTLSGNFQVWSKNHALLKGYVPGDTAGNLAFGVHALMAGYVALGGALQLVPQIRRYAPRFHRWNGRIFLVMALGISVTGLYMIWVRGGATNLTGAAAISLNGALIILLAVMAWRTALVRDIVAHRRWALRTWLVANGQWFFRVGIFGWIILNRGPVGLGDNFDGPVVVFWEFGCYLVPLAVLELYLRIKQSGGAGARFATAAGLFAFALLTVIGVAAVAFIMWRPVLARL